MVDLADSAADPFEALTKTLSTQIAAFLGAKQSPEGRLEQ
jgi:hypothetical protein